MIDSAQYTTLDVSAADGVLVCVLNRPDVLNAIDMTMHDELERLFEALRREESVRSVLITGAGRAFSAGGDVSAMADGRMGELTGRPGGLYTREGVWLIRALLSVPQPIVAAVNGPAVGLGTTIALFSDAVVASETASFSDPHVTIGLVAGDGAAIVWTCLLGPLRAKRYLLTGERLSAPEAHRLGLVTDLCGPDEARDVAESLARRLAAAPAPAVQWTKRSVNRVLWERTVADLDASLALEALSAGTQEHHDAVRTFRDRRRR